MRHIDNFLKLRKEIPDDITMIIAAKTRSPREVAEIIDAGATEIGENYVQEAETMYNDLGEKAGKATWHLIGHLQKNKINKALPIFDMVQTVDSVKLARAIDKRAARMNKKVRSLIEINIAAENAKSGMPPNYEMLEELVNEYAQLEYLSLEGFMTMGPAYGDPEESRPYFTKTKEIFDYFSKKSIKNVEMKTLSMGMTNSFRIAIEEGANMIRLGTIIFGARD